MKYVINQIRMNIDDSTSLEEEVAKRAGVHSKEIQTIKIIKESIDARHKNKIELIYNVEFLLDGELKGNYQKSEDLPENEYVFEKGLFTLNSRPVIIGTGPAGLFAGLFLARNGFNPILLERGTDVDSRTASISSFWDKGEFSANTNVQFGEGGAGTFSDGKLTTRINDKRAGLIVDELIKAGAPSDIAYKAKPHIGTDILRDVIKGIRNQILESGGEVLFNSKVDEIVLDSSSCIKAVKANGAVFDAQVAVLAIGHSARDTYEMLFSKGIKMTAKPFSIGARIEHPQELIDFAQYGKYAGHPKLGRAEYQLAYKNGDRAAYTFCMCPGGFVVAAASEEGRVVTNGMSYHAREGKNANSAFVVSVGPTDFGSSHPLAGIEFQRHWEETAFREGGMKYYAPIQTLADFVDSKVSKTIGSVNPTYKPGTELRDLNNCLPKFVTEMMKSAVKEFDKKINGFAMKDALLTGIETRTSAPVRIHRNETYQAEGITGLYPAGEGAGYAGGIVSAAVDGLRVAEAIMAKYHSQ